MINGMSVLTDSHSKGGCPTEQSRAFLICVQCPVSLDTTLRLLCMADKNKLVTT